MILVFITGIRRTGEVIVTIPIRAGTGPLRTAVVLRAELTVVAGIPVVVPFAAPSPADLRRADIPVVRTVGVGPASYDDTLTGVVIADRSPPTLEVRFVTFFRRTGDSIAAAGHRLAIIAAGIAILAVAVIAFFSRIDSPVPTNFFETVGRTAVARSSIPVVALLRRTDKFVPAHRRLTLRGAVIAIILVAVVAILPRIHKAVAATGPDTLTVPTDFSLFAIGI